MSAFDAVLVKRGSATMSFAPLFLAFKTHLSEIGWFSAALLPITRITSAFLKSTQLFDAHPRPTDSARAGMLVACQVLVLSSKYTIPQERMSF